MSQRTTQRPVPQRPSLRMLVPSVLINLVAPIVCFFVTPPFLPNDTVALAIASAIPVVRTLYVWAVRKRLEPIGALAAVALILAVALSAVWNGGSLPIKLHEAMLTCLLGLVCLGS